jgi:hypothetical protein
VGLLYRTVRRPFDSIRAKRPTLPKSLRWRVLHSALNWWGGRITAQASVAGLIKSVRPYPSRPLTRRPEVSNPVQGYHREIGRSLTGKGRGRPANSAHPHR